MAGTDKALCNRAKGPSTVHATPSGSALASSRHIVTSPVQAAVSITNIRLAPRAVWLGTVAFVAVARNRARGVSDTGTFAAAVGKVPAGRLREDKLRAELTGPSILALTAPSSSSHETLAVATVAVIGCNLARLAGIAGMAHTHARRHAQAVAGARARARGRHERAVHAMEAGVTVAQNSGSIDVTSSAGTAAVGARYKGRAVFTGESGMANADAVDTVSSQVTEAQLLTLCHLRALWAGKSGFADAGSVDAARAVAGAEVRAVLERVRIAVGAGVAGSTDADGCRVGGMATAAAARVAEAKAEVRAVGRRVTFTKGRHSGMCGHDQETVLRRRED